MIEEDFRTRAARAIIAHRPEIVLGGDADDLGFRKTRDLLPQRERFVIGVVHGDQQLFDGQAPHFGQQGPGMGDRLLLEVVAERKIAQHFKERVMARGIAHVVEVVMLAACANTLLRRSGARHGARFHPGKDVLERDHASVREHQRRIVVRHKRRRGHHVVPLRAEVFQEGAADFVRRAHARRLGDRTALNKHDSAQGIIVQVLAVAVTIHAAAENTTASPIM